MKTKKTYSHYFRVLRIPLSITLTLIGCGLLAASQEKFEYKIIDLPSLGGTNSRANSVNNRDWFTGYSNLTGDQNRHATLWRDNKLTDLGTLGGPNSDVPFSVKSNTLISGIAQTATPDPLGEAWSSAAFYPGATGTGYINLGFVWEDGKMRALPTLGGNNGFAAGANSCGLVVGWAETTEHDSTCVPPQQLQFLPVVYGKGPNEIRALPLVPGDTSGAAVSINERGQVVGISGICDQAVGRYTARHALLWDKNGKKTIDLGNLGAPYWNTPTNINQRGDVVGFAGAPNDPDGNFLQAFIWTKERGMKGLGFLPGDVHSEAYGLNERRQVVGLSCDANGNCRAFIWQNGVMRDLNDFKPANYTKTLEQARDINDEGEIAGRALDANGVRTAFRAIPRDD
jgi:probable HAF family extracellular repeat protein